MNELDLNSCPGPRSGVRFTHDTVRNHMAALQPEGVLLLSETAAEVVLRCDGATPVRAIIEGLSEAYDHVPPHEVLVLLTDLVERRILTPDRAGGQTSSVWEGTGDTTLAARHADPRSGPAPVGLTAELTYRCPLQCAYCSNPLELQAYRNELTTDEWLRVIDESRELGVLQVHFSGGEPLLRRDLPELVSRARERGIYSNLVTSGIPLSDRILGELVDAGLEHLQLSLQDSEQPTADVIAGVQAHQRKLRVAAIVRQTGIPFTVNVVLHRGNVDRLIQIAELAVGIGCDRLELAHTQFYGWALRNKDVLLPTPEQVARANDNARLVQERYGEDIEILYVAADYHSGIAKPCMGGWGDSQLILTPTGDVLPCLAAGQIPGLGVQSVRDHPLEDIWFHSPAFQRFRGTDWMQEPCRSCDLREIDYGGCRCQAFQLTGDAAATDPACRFSPRHEELLAQVRAPADDTARIVPRRMVKASGGSE